jgi:acetoin utilization deacetylase AcuC-like enzyme
MVSKAYSDCIRIVLLLIVAQLLMPCVTHALAGKAVPVFFDSTNHFHRDLQYHPEMPERIKVCVEAVENYRQQGQSDSVELIDIAADASTPYPGVQSTHAPFTDDELKHARDMLLQVHSEEIVLELEERCRRSKQQRLDAGKPALGHMGYIDSDTYLTTETFDICLRATAAWIRATDFCSAVALTRPPGHHATRTNQNGFCLYNFAAAATAHVLAKDPSAKVSVIDWDVHYGQGVAEILQNHERSRYVSIHQTPAFPYMGGSFKRFGQYENILTIPMLADTTWTCGYKELFDKALQFMCKSGEWEPDVVIICAGYDALASDELAGVSLNAEDYGRMTKQLIAHLDASTGKRARLVVGLEGGYQLKPGAGGGNLQQAVVETVRALVEG